MRSLRLHKPFLYFLLAVSLFSCKKQTEDTDPYDYNPERLKEVMPLEVGKYITYRLDSLVFEEFQQIPVTYRYKVKHVIDAEITDNLGRPSYRVYRYITADTTNADPDWQPNGSYFITPVTNGVELIEDNLRVIKLQLPVKEGYQWKGNSYLPVDPYGPFGYSFSNDDDMKDWEFYYDTPGLDFSYNGVNYSDVYSVEEHDDAAETPTYSYKSRAVEKYSKDIGLVFRHFEIWEYQAPPSGSPHPSYTGFGVIMWMTDHN